MKHPARYVSKRLRQVKRGRRALSREVSCAARKMKEDPLVRKVLTEVAHHFLGITLRILALSAVNQCVRIGGSAQVISIRSKPIAVS
jgi:hypothetical protein